MIKFTKFVINIISIGSILFVYSVRHCSFNATYRMYTLTLCQKSFLDSQDIDMTLMQESESDIH